MRRTFAKLVFKEMYKNPNLYVVTADLGYKMWDMVRDAFPNRFFNVGAAEQLMIGVAIGLTLERKIVITYSITPFLLFRPAELIRTYINHENIPVKLVGSGRGKEYEHDGISHWATSDSTFVNLFKNIKSYRPCSIEELELNFLEFLYNNKPSYLNLRR